MTKIERSALIANSIIDECYAEYIENLIINFNNGVCVGRIGGIDAIETREDVVRSIAVANDYLHNLNKILNSHKELEG